MSKPDHDYNPATPLPSPAVDESQILAERRAKLRSLRSSGLVAYPNDVHPSHRAHQLHEQYASHSRETLESEHVSVGLAGRIMLKRVQGKASFLTLQDATGRIQLYLNDEGVGEQAHEAVKHWDLGDQIAC